MNNFWSQIDPKRQRQIKMISLVLMLIVGVLLVIYLSTKGWLHVKTNESSSIIKVFDQNNDLVASSEGRDSLSIWLSIGEYTISAQNRTSDNYIKKNVTIEPFRTLNIELTIPKNPEPEAVTNINMQLPHFTPNKIYFFDTLAQRIGVVGEDNNINYINHKLSSVRKMHWNDDGTGYILGKIDLNDSAKLFFYNGTSLISILTEDQVGSLSFALNEEEVLYVVHGNKLYSSSNQGENLQELATVVSGQIWTAHDSKLIMVKHGPRIINNQPNFAYDIISTDTSGKEYGTLNKKTGESADVAYDASWSPDGTKLLVADGYSGIIYNQSLREVGRLPEGLVRSPEWENSSSILYAGDNSIWRYGVEDKTSVSVASVPQVFKIYSMQSTSDGTIYFMSGSQKFASWYRINPSSNSTPNELANLIGGSNTQILSPFCTMNYLNFKKLSIVERFDVSRHPGYQDTPIETRRSAPSELCRKDIESYFERMRFSLDQVNIQSFIFPL